MRVILLGAAFFLAGCEAQNMTFTEVARADQVAGPSIVSDTQAVAAYARERFDLSNAASANVSLSRATVCEASEVVLPLMGIAYSCAVDGGDVSIGGDFDSPQTLFVTFVRAVRSTGAQVDLAPDGVNIRGSGGGDAVGGFAGDVPPGLEGADVVQGVDAYTTTGSRVTDIASSGFFQNLDVSTGFLRGYSVGDVNAVSASAGLPIEAVAVSGGVMLLGTDTDILVMRDLLAGQVETVAIMPPNGAPAAAVSLLSSRYFVDVERDGDTGSLVVAGLSEDVAAFGAALRRLGGSSADIRVEAAFLRSSASALRSAGITAGVAFSSGDVLLRFGDPVGGSPFSLVVDAMQSQAGVAADVRPTLTVAPGVPARFVDGREVPVVVATDEDGRSEVEYRAVGSIVNATAFPMAGGFIRLRLNIEVSAVDGEGVLENPEFSSRSVQTEVVLQPGQMVLLSGLDSSVQVSENRRTLGLFPARSGGSDRESLSFLVSVAQR